MPLLDDITMPSFDTVNYSIRPNKSVERKIAFSSLLKLSSVVPLASHRFVGLGSLWFIDFLMAHRVLGISTMTSIERSELGAKRAKYNCPLACIQVERGDTTAVIPSLNFEDIPSVVWFDYDTSIGGPVLNDIDLLVSMCTSNSIIMVTINAKRDELPTLDENENKIEYETSLRNIAGDLVPTPLATNQFQPARYSKLLCEILENKFRSSVNTSGRTEIFIKLFDLAYSDGTPMVTVGGILATADKANAINQLVEAGDWEGIAEELIAIPPLTMKEKMALDRTLPSEAPLTVAEMDGIGFQLKQAQINAYHRYYLHYPIFGEFLF
jgi:hypothetical protein